MPCLLRIDGVDLDVDDLIKSTSLTPERSYRKGEPKYPRRKHEGPLHESSGLSFLVSDTGFNDLEKQIEDTVAFLENHAEELQHLRDITSIEVFVLDFGIEHQDVMGQYERFPARLLRLAGNLDTDLEISLYNFGE